MPVPRATVPAFGVHDTNGGYSRFQQYLFQRPSYDTSYYDPSQFPPTFVSPLPFAFPESLTQESHDSMFLALCHQFHQTSMDRSLGDHNIYAYHASQGHFPQGTQHLGYYVPPPPDAGNGSGFGGAGGDVPAGDAGNDAGGDEQFFESLDDAMEL